MLSNIQSNYKKVSRSQEGFAGHKPPELPQLNTNRSVYFADNKLQKPESEDLEMLNNEEVLDDKALPQDAAAVWINMDNVEFDKLEWMSKTAHRAQFERMEATTQYDKDGRAVPSADLEDRLKTGEQTHDIYSLINLLDSAYDPQVNYSLNVISKICNLATMGYYDGAFDENIYQMIINNCLLRVRRHIDSPNENICLATLNCMKSMLDNIQVDEVILDRIHPLISDQIDPNLWLKTIEMETKPFDTSMHDSKCAEIDAVLTLIQRTSIFVRFDKLIEEKELVSYHKLILDIILRILRHSLAACLMLIRSGLLNNLINKFLPVGINNESKAAKSLALKTLKISRIVSQALKEIRLNPRVKRAYEIKLPNALKDRVSEYFFIDCISLGSNQDDIFKVYIETIRLIIILVEFDEFRQDMVELIALAQERLIKDFKKLSTLDPLHHIIPKISIDWQYTAHMIDLLASIIRNEALTVHRTSSRFIWITYISPMTLGWLNKLMRMRFIPHLDVSIAIARAMLCFNDCDQNGSRHLRDLISDSQDGDTTSSMTGHSLNYFKYLVQSASAKSQLPSVLDINGKLRDPINLPSYGFLNYITGKEYKFDLTRVIDDDSPFILLDALINQLQTLTPDVLKKFVECYELHRYILTSTQYHNLPKSYESIVQQSIPNQREIHMISRSLLMIARYYLDPQILDGILGDGNCGESKELKESRVGAYSQIIFCGLSTVCLLSRAASSLDLKEQLIVKILFDDEIHHRAARETFAQVDHKRYERTNLVLDPSTAEITINHMTKKKLQILLPVYQSCEQPSRFWVLQPLIEFYEDQVKNAHAEVSKKLRGRWFRTNITPTGTHTTDFNDCSDGDIISVILLFNYAMLKTSPAYLKLVVQPNLEDYMCVIGSIFLDDELFLTPQVSRALQMNLEIILSNCLDEKDATLFSDASKKIVPLDLLLSDFFNKLVEQYEGVSYGDETFANFLLLFMTQVSDKIFRKKLFQELAETCLSQLNICIESVWIPKELFYSKQEPDQELRALMRVARTHVTRGTFLNQYVAFHSQNPK